MKKILFIIVVFLLVVQPVYGEEKNLLAPSAKSAILIEVSTGEVLYEFNSHEKLAPASMTKMMSLLLIMEALENGSIKYEDMVTASKNASDMGGSQILLEEGEKMSVDDLLKGITIASGNDAVVAMAETIGGSEANFVNMMNKKANELGLKDTHFQNSHGLDEENHYSSAYDMAMIARELVKHEKILEYSSIEIPINSLPNPSPNLPFTTDLIITDIILDAIPIFYPPYILTCLSYAFMQLFRNALFL